MHRSVQAAASAGPPGPFYAPSGLPPTPAAAAVAAAATAAGGLLSPRAASFDRRGSAFLDAPPGTASRATGSGWGHWAGSTGAGEPSGGGGGSGGGTAAACGAAVDKRGAGLGQELITPLQVDPSIDFDQVRPGDRQVEPGGWVLLLARPVMCNEKRDDTLQPSCRVWDRQALGCAKPITCGSQR